MKELHIRASRDRTFDEIGVSIFEHDKINGKIYQGEIEFKEVPDGERIETTLYISKDYLRRNNNVIQVLMDDLWQCGIRPSEGQGSAGQLKAVENHLSDMRKITFKKLEINEQK